MAAPWAASAGALNAAMAVTLFDNLVSVTPEADRTNFIAVYNVAVNIALFAGPIIAGVLAANGAQIVCAAGGGGGRDGGRDIAGNAVRGHAR